MRPLNLCLPLADRVLLSGVAETLRETLDSNRDQRQFTKDLGSSIERLSKDLEVSLTERRETQNSTKFLTHAILHPDDNDAPSK